MQHLLRGAVRPIRDTGQAGRRGESAKSDERLSERDPVREGARNVVLGSARLFPNNSECLRNIFRNFLAKQLRVFPENS